MRTEQRCEISTTSTAWIDVLGHVPGQAETVVDISHERIHGELDVRLVDELGHVILSYGTSDEDGFNGFRRHRMRDPARQINVQMRCPKTRSCGAMAYTTLTTYRPDEIDG